MTLSRRSRHSLEQPRNIVFAHDTNSFGGLEVVVLELLRHLDAKRFHSFVMIPGYNEPDFASPAMFIERVKALNVSILQPPHPGHQGVRSHLRDIANISRLLRSVHTDIVHIHTARVEGARKVTLSARLAGVPVVVRTEHNSPSAFSSASAKSYKTRLFDLLTNQIVTVSEHDRQEQIQYFGRPTKKVYRSYNGVDMAKFKNRHDTRNAKVRLGFDPDIAIVGTVGRLTEQKGHCYLIEAAAQILQHYSRVCFLLVGNGELEAQLKAQAASLGIAKQICFAGYQPDPILYIEAMDIAVMSSLHEGFSLSLLEFMALGKPTVVTDHPGMIEAMLDGVTGLVVERQNSAALADGILSLLSNTTRAQAMGRAARNHVEANFSFARYVNDMMSLYDRLAG